MTRPARIAILISILAVAIRLIWISQPSVDNWSWRQSDVAAIARNYFQGGFHFARPQIDWAGNSEGYVGTEFPILPFIAALCYKMFGIHEWVGRVQALILFALSLPFFFLLVRKIFGEIASVWALSFYSFAPLGIMASRCFMPDMPSLALSIIGLYFFDRWIDDDGSIRLRQSFGGQASFLVSAVCISLSILIKLPSVLIGAPLACLAAAAVCDRRIRVIPTGVEESLTISETLRDVSTPLDMTDGSHRAPLQLLVFAAIALIPAALWYSHAYQISLQFYPHHFFGAGGVQIMSVGWYMQIAKLIVTSTLTPLLFVLGVVGAVVTSLRSAPAWQARATPRPRDTARPFHWWLAVMILFMIVVGYGNRHQWYQLPLIPIFAAFAGAACAFLATKFASRAAKMSLSALLLLSFIFLAAVYASRFYQPSAAPLRDAGLKIKALSPADAVVVALDNGDPTLLYYAERKGWHFLEKDGIYDGEPKDSAQAIADLDQLRRRGASYLVFTSNTAWWLDYYTEFGKNVAAVSTVVGATPEFKIYKLNPVPK